MDCLEIHVELTNKCILNCKHCSSLANKCTNELEFDDILNFIEKLGDEYNIRLILTGGEPLLKQNLIDFISKTNLKCNNIEVGLFTTGLILENKMITSLPDKYLNDLKDAGMKFVYISVYSTDEKIHDNITGVVGSYKYTIDCIKKMIKNNIITNVNLVIMKWNIRELQKIVTELINLGVNEVRVLRLIKHGFALNNWDLIGCSYEEQSNAVKKLLKSNIPQISLGGFIELSKCQYFSENQQCLAGKNKLYINNKGEIYPCGAVKNNINYKIGELSKISEFHKHDSFKCKCIFTKN